jgi:hypothetical protein
MPLDPPTDLHGNVVAHDDQAIVPASMLIRHINEAAHVVFDENRNCRRIARLAFSATSGDPDDGMSVDIGQLLAEAGLQEDAQVPRGMGAVKLEVGQVRALVLRVGSDPIPTNKYHGQVWGVKDSKRQKLHSVVVDWVVPIPGVALR